MRKHSALLAAALLVSSTGVGMAQGQSPNSQQKSPATSGQSSGSQSDPRGPGMTGAPSSTNPQAGGGGAGYQTPRETPEAGGAPDDTDSQSEQAITGFNLRRCVVRGGHSAPLLLTAWYSNASNARLL
jgi:hypothetical protein